MDLFRAFQRRQVVTDCWRKENGKWTIKSAPFIDDWGEEEYQELIRCLANTITGGGLVYGAFIRNELKGFLSVEGQLAGSRFQYLDLSSIHVKNCIYLPTAQWKARLFTAQWAVKKLRNTMPAM